MKKAVVGLAVTFSTLTATIDARAQEERAFDPDLGVLSTGRMLKAPKAARTFSPSSPGRVVPGQALDALANFKARSESAAEAAAKTHLKPVTAPVGRETIIGADTLTRVSPTTSYPARATVLITFSDGRCTGWLINANTVVTAGHCIHPGGSGGAFYPTSSYRVSPGYNGTSAPYGSCTARWTVTTNGWAANGDDRYDYGAIRQNCQIGRTTGWYGFFWTATTLTGLPTVINGYPGDKPLTQWRSTDLVRLTQAQRLFYQNDTTGGMSGSPVYYNRSGCGVCAMAVHTYGLYGSPPFSTNNHGTRITRAVYDNLVAWQNAP